ncbi:nuclease-related domain-containing protein [Sporosarcina trichiuri]|uniref:nuclease-related domain-containing protein n=1 Tax=Sporosarcina trichiuri TaxID=3056445 RepID=UPI0025B58B67|nr:NERD domain-containing protein [Sporosarcina sp. 0.2-SM1T-5]WJY27932.1 NERD domain-containing protein [Sporosarcina sp. 0.2-SM1T-5]
MAQLVKMLDYVSRYEQDLSRYTAQFIRLKRSQWERMKRQWDNGVDLAAWQQTDEGTEEAAAAAEGTQPKKRFFTLSRLLPFRKEETPEEEARFPAHEEELEFVPNLIQQPRSVQQLRKLYVDQLFHFQVKWASSTLTEWSNVDGGYLRDRLLKELLGRLPDSFLVFYYPVLKLKKAPVELEVIMLTPVECLCITVMTGKNGSVFTGSGDRFWAEKIGDKESRLLNPMISLNRMTKIIASLFSAAELDFPIRKVLLTKDSYLDFTSAAHDIVQVDRRNFDKWTEKLKAVSVPMKSKQFKAAQTILSVCQTTAASRLFDPRQQGGEQP